MRKRIMQFGVAVAALALAPMGVRADSFSDLVCTGTAFDICVNFALTDNGGGSYALQTTFASSTAPSGQEGVLTSTGIYSILSSPTFSFTGLAITSAPTGTSWSLGNCGDLAGDPASSLLVCASADAPPTANGLTVGQSVIFTFTSNQNIAATDFGANGELGFRAHVQSIGPLKCSMKPDSRIGVVGGVDAANARCGGPETTVPEPISMFLVGSGLLGVGAVRRRRKGLDVVNG